MRTLTLLILTLFVSLVSYAQKTEGEITYEKVYHWTRLNARLSFLSNEEKERMKMTWANNDEHKVEMLLAFNEKLSYYTYPKTEENDGGYSWRKGEYRIYRDFENEKRADIIEMLGKTYIVDDSLKFPKWKIMNKIKEIGGYMCMMAVTQDTIKDQKVTAWFADGIPVSGGPEQYSGLPGMILELDINDGDIVTTAKEIKLKPVTDDISIPKKLKGKKVNTQKYEEMMSVHIRDSIKAHRNPFWSMPY
ncbi:GLPGLI family protein [Dyadobacter pollutisoli]|uniref:GLPGLI family protein n=1 Tax=Dyadobacter pollutisoli TaxID=2910158 RepID=A0A9E8N654_9BACT|nr:GLPGLI family protein [Dyadobacter pollutisoli]WAC09277.1 GLPGLI family protein [Dyadobacter pollutisoli]